MYAWENVSLSCSSNFYRLVFAIVVYVHWTSTTSNASSWKLPMSSCPYLCLYGAEFVWILCISSISLSFGCSFDLFQLIETVLLKSTNFEFIVNYLHRVLQFKRNGYHSIDICLQIKAKFTTFKSISARKNSFYTSQPEC